MILPTEQLTFGWAYVPKTHPHADTMRLLPNPRRKNTVGSERSNVIPFRRVKPKAQQCQRRADFPF